MEPLFNPQSDEQTTILSSDEQTTILTGGNPPAEEMTTLLSDAPADAIPVFCDPDSLNISFDDVAADNSAPPDIIYSTTMESDSETSALQPVTESLDLYPIYDSSSEDLVPYEPEEKKGLFASIGRFCKTHTALMVSLAAFLFVAIAALLLLNIFLFQPLKTYNNAVKLRDEDKYAEAIAEFSSISNFRDSQEQITKTRYVHGCDLYDQGKYYDSYKEFSAIEYEDSAARSLLSHYMYATELMNSGKLTDAASHFSSLGDYTPPAQTDETGAVVKAYDSSPEMQKLCNYKYGQHLLGSRLFTEAEAVFSELGDYTPKSSVDPATGQPINYSSSAIMAKECGYQYACSLYTAKNYADAATAFEGLSGYKDSARQALHMHYLVAKGHMEAGLYETAIDEFTAISSYSDSERKANDCRYYYVKSHFDKTNSTTMAYIDHLKSVGYPGAQKLYKDLTKWTIKIVTNTSSSDTATDMRTASVFSTWYFHMSVSGGPTDGRLRMRYQYTWPDGTKTSYTPSTTAYDGWRGYDYESYSYFDDCKTGTFTIRVYNADTNELLASDSIKLIN